MLKIGNMTLYDAAELAKFLGIHVQTARVLIRNGTLKGKKLAKKWYVNEEDLKAYFQVSTPESER